MLSHAVSQSATALHSPFHSPRCSHCSHCCPSIVQPRLASFRHAVSPLPSPHLGPSAAPSPALHPHGHSHSHSHGHGRHSSLVGSLLSTMWHAESKGAPPRCEHIHGESGGTAVDEESCNETIRKPDSWCCELCETSNGIRLCLACGSCACERWGRAQCTLQLLLHRGVKLNSSHCSSSSSSNTSDTVLPLSLVPPLSLSLPRSRCPLPCSSQTLVRALREAPRAHAVPAAQRRDETGLLLLVQVPRAGRR